MSQPMPYLLALALVAWSGQADAQKTAEEIVEKSLAALGGRAAHEKIQSRQATGTIALSTPAGEIAGTIEILNARPNKTRALIKAELPREELLDALLGMRHQLAARSRMKAKQVYRAEALRR